ncbi:MAG TPA: hypothetical protein VLR88_07575, partial [Propionibacteriaceae bacterium]|nr:hypothetical protein [Propionibacteriaceae bacterium]
YAAVADGVQQVLTATPAVAPPAGFSGRVLEAMAAAEGPTTIRTGFVRPRRRTYVLVAAAIALGLAIGVGGTLAATTIRQRVVATEHVPVASQLLNSKGESVGSAGLATLDGRSYLLINVTTGRPGASYECILVGENGTRTSGGSWSLTDEYGTGVASGSWLVPLSGAQPASVELVTASGNVWSRGRF